MNAEPNDCPNCDGFGMIDSGGVTPWGQPIDFPCPVCSGSGTPKKVVCVDFDGVIHSFTSPWHPGCPPLDPPVPGAITFLRQLVNEGMRVIIFSCRSESEEGIEGMKTWMTEKGFFFVNCYEFTSKKPIADIYIDDKAYEFRGIFPTLDFIERFKPWNR